MKKSIVLLMVIFCSVFIIGASKEKVNYEYYSGRKLGGEFQKSSIIVEPKSKSYYINMDKITTNLDLAIVEKSLLIVKEQVEGSEDPYKNESTICFALALTDATVKMDWSDGKHKMKRLDKNELKALSDSADKNGEVIKESGNVNWLYLSKEKSGIQMIVTP